MTLTLTIIPILGLLGLVWVLVTCPEDLVTVLRKLVGQEDDSGLDADSPVLLVV